MKKTFVIVFLSALFAFNIMGQSQRVVSLAPSNTKIIYSLDASNQLVGCTNYCTEAINDNKQVVANVITVNIEKLISQKPDLVLATGLTNTENIETIKKFGIRVEVIQSPKNFKEICEQYISIGEMLGKKEQALKTINAIKNKVENIQKESKKLEPHKTFFQIGADPLFTVIPNTFMNDYITLTNGTNIITEVNTGMVSKESVITRKPDYIFIATMGMVAKQEKAAWENFKNLPATANNNIYIIDPDIACTPTPQNFLKTLEIMNENMKSN